MRISNDNNNTEKAQKLFWILYFFRKSGFYCDVDHHIHRQKEEQCLDTMFTNRCSQVSLQYRSRKQEGDRIGGKKLRKENKTENRHKS